ncbi:ScbR family autoregulator-binding transcription factor [Streptomyces sp. NPDC000151]|uniref:ScbR family autoregulator-binding transcription factor n=1 Tax=Streptomyces sp. NPDC000151 TaxID=3154244 RepID=UPI00331C00C3
MSRQRQDRALHTRATIVRAAAEVFAEQGYAGASVTRITERAGLTMGAMYFHFKNKAALAREIVLDQPGRVQTPRTSVGLQHAVDITLAWARQLLDDPVLLAGARLVMEQEEFIGPEQNSHQQWVRIFEAELATAEERGELLDGCDRGALARLIVNACTGAQMHAQMATGHRDLPVRVAEMWGCLLPALATPEARAAIDLDISRGKAS